MMQYESNEQRDEMKIEVYSPNTKKIYFLFITDNIYLIITHVLL